jgi:hypothetical protein
VGRRPDNVVEGHRSKASSKRPGEASVEASSKA